MANRGESVAEFASFGSGVADSVGGQQRKIQRTRDIDRRAIAGFFFALEMTLQFNVDVAGAKDSYQLIDDSPRFVDATLPQRSGQRAFRAAGEADESGSVLLQFVGTDRALAFLRAQLHLGDQAAKILVAGARGDEERKTGKIVTPRKFRVPSGTRNPWLLHVLMGVGILRLRQCCTSCSTGGAQD